METKLLIRKKTILTLLDMQEYCKSFVMDLIDNIPVYRVSYLELNLYVLLHNEGNKL